MTTPRTLFKDYSDNQRQRHHEEVGQTMSRVTREYLEEMEHDSIFFRKNLLRSIPSLEPCGKQHEEMIVCHEYSIYPLIFFRGLYRSTG